MLPALTDISLYCSTPEKLHKERWNDHAYTFQKLLNRLHKF